MSRYVILSLDDPEQLYVVSQYDGFFGATSTACSEDDIPDQALWFDDLDDAKTVHDRIARMDERYFPQCVPQIARVENGRIVERLSPPEGVA